jgi:hypothetical protein
MNFWNESDTNTTICGLKQYGGTKQVGLAITLKIFIW